MRKLFGAWLAVTALSPVVASAQAGAQGIRADVGVEAQREDRVDMGPRPVRRDDADRGDRRNDRGRDAAPDTRGDRPRGPDAGPDRQPGQPWNGRQDADRDDRRPRQPGDGRPDDRRPGDGQPGDGRYGGGFGNRYADRDRAADARRSDWTRSRLDRRDDRWTQSRFDDRSAWNRGWRNDGRYDWNRYRDTNRSAYRLPRYYAPQGWGGGYRRYGVGIGLQAPLFGRNYWIADPYAYRLPAAYGPYRWVRYYGDALLVDLRSGLVVDAVYGIFW